MESDSNDSEMYRGSTQPTRQTLRTSLHNAVSSKKQRREEFRSDISLSQRYVNSKRHRDEYAGSDEDNAYYRISQPARQASRTSSLDASSSKKQRREEVTSNDSLSQRYVNSRQRRSEDTESGEDDDSPNSFVVHQSWIIARHWKPPLEQNKVYALTKSLLIATAFTGRGGNDSLYPTHHPDWVNKQARICWSQAVDFCLAGRGVKHSYSKPLPTSPSGQGLWKIREALRFARNNTHQKLLAVIQSFAPPKSDGNKVFQDWALDQLRGHKFEKCKAGRRFMGEMVVESLVRLYYTGSTALGIKKETRDYFDPITPFLLAATLAGLFGILKAISQGVKIDERGNLTHRSSLNSTDLAEALEVKMSHINKASHRDGILKLLTMEVKSLLNTQKDGFADILYDSEGLDWDPSDTAVPSNLLPTPQSSSIPASPTNNLQYQADTNLDPRLRTTSAAIQTAQAGTIEQALSGETLFTTPSHEHREEDWLNPKFDEAQDFYLGPTGPPTEYIKPSSLESNPSRSLSDPPYWGSYQDQNKSPYESPREAQNEPQNEAQNEAHNEPQNEPQIELQNEPPREPLLEPSYEPPYRMRSLSGGDSDPCSGSYTNNTSSHQIYQATSSTRRLEVDSRSHAEPVPKTRSQRQVRPTKKQEMLTKEKESERKRSRVQMISAGDDSTLETPAAEAKAVLTLADLDNGGKQVAWESISCSVIDCIGREAGDILWWYVIEEHKGASGWCKIQTIGEKPFNAEQIAYCRKELQAASRRKPRRVTVYPWDMNVEA